MLQHIILDVRKELSLNYDITSKDFLNYTGLCDRSIVSVFAKFNERVAPLLNKHDIPYKLIPIHGEQKHSFKISSQYWPYQHTWGKIVISGKAYYVDPTSQQFKWIYGDDIPDYYVSTNPPKWYYPDINNPVFNRPWSVLQHITVPFRDSDGYSKIPLIDFMQYYVWSTISEKIYNTFYNNKK